MKKKSSQKKNKNTSVRILVHQYFIMTAGVILLMLVTQPIVQPPAVLGDNTTFLARDGGNGGGDNRGGPGGSGDNHQSGPQSHDGGQPDPVHTNPVQVFQGTTAASQTFHLMRNGDDRAEASNQADFKVNDESELESSDAGKIIHTKSQFPLSIDPVTHQLVVTTPAGTKELHVLPERAIQAVLAAGLLNQIAATPSASATGAAESQQIALTTLNNQPVFSVSGESNKHFLAFIPVSIPKTVLVSADTGQVVQTQESIFNRVLDALSF